MAAGSTYTPIATYTLGSSASSYTFTSIPSTYTDLVVIVSAAVTSNDDLLFRVNGDSGNNYSTTFLYGTGSSAGSARVTNSTFGYVDNYGTPGTTLGSSVQILNLMNYSNSTTYKTFISRANRAASGTDANVVLWRNTAAITSLTLLCNTANLIAGSTFTLYGIQAA